MLTLHPRPLTVEEIDQEVVNFKEGLTRECERMCRRGDNTGALAAIHGKEYIDKFVYNLKVRAGHQGFGFPVAAPVRSPRARSLRMLRQQKAGV